jgi:hypothetical protein
VDQPIFLQLFIPHLIFAFFKISFVALNLILELEVHYTKFWYYALLIWIDYSWFTINSTTADRKWAVKLVCYFPDWNSHFLTIIFLRVDPSWTRKRSWKSIEWLKSYCMQYFIMKIRVLLLESGLLVIFLCKYHVLPHRLESIYEPFNESAFFRKKLILEAV